MLAAWRPGARSAPHDHGEAQGIVIVLAGTFVETRFEFDGGALAPRRNERHRAWDALTAPEGVIHQMGSEGIGFTLHVYAPCIDRMRVFDVARRSTLVVTGDSGAWVDDGASSERVAWES